MGAERLREEEKGVNNASSLNKQLLASYFLIKRIRESYLISLMPEKRGKGLYLTFVTVLGLIRLYPYKNKDNLCRLGGYHRTGLDNALSYLLGNGFIKVSPHARKVIPLDVWTYDKTYSVTREGKKLLKAIFEGLLDKPL